MATLIDNDPLGIETAPRVDPLGIERKSDPLGVERLDPLGIDTERNSRIDAGLDFFRQSHPELYPEQGPGLEQVDSLAPAVPQIERPAPIIPPELGQTPERPNTLENAMSGVGQPIEEPPGITPRMESPENLSPLEVLRKGTSMPAPRISDSEAATLMPPWLAPHVAGVQRSMADFVDFATSPAGIATTLTSGAASADAVAGHLVSKATATAFALDMAQNLPDQFDAAVNAIQRGDKAEATRAMVNGAAALLMIGHAAKANAPMGAPPRPNGVNALERPESVSDVSGQARQSAPESSPPTAVQPNSGTPVAPVEPTPLEKVVSEMQAPRPDVTANMIDELRGALNKNQIVRPSGNPFETLPEAKPETPAETPGDVVRKAVEEQPLTPGIVFRTAKGSSYEAHSDGTTTRTKAARPEHPGDIGTKERSTKTVYVETQFANDMLDNMNSLFDEGDWMTWLNKDGVPVGGIVKPRNAAGVKVPVSETPIPHETQPRVGLSPVEYWEKNGRTSVHVGNPITEVRGMQEKPPQAVAGVETPGTRETLPSAETVATESAQPSGEKPVETVERETLLARKERILQDIDDWKNGGRATPGQPATGQNYGRAMVDNIRRLDGELKAVNDRLKETSQKPPALTPEEQAAEQRTLAEELGQGLPSEHEISTAPLEEGARSGSREPEVVGREVRGNGWQTAEQRTPELDQAANRAWKRAKATIEKAQQDQRKLKPSSSGFSEQQKAAYDARQRLIDVSNGIIQRAEDYAKKSKQPVETTLKRLTNDKAEQEVRSLYEGDAGNELAELQRLQGALNEKQKARFGPALEVVKRRLEKAADVEARNKRMAQPDLGVNLEHPSEESLTTKAAKAEPIERRGPLGGNISTFGLFDPEAYRPAFEELSDRSKMLFRWGDKQREKVVARYRRGDTRNFIARTKDGSDSIAKLMGQRGANIILHELNRSFDVKPEDVGGDRSQLREMALTMRIESGGETAALQEMRYRLTDAKAEGVNLVWKRKALKAIEFAEQHWDKLEPAATEYQRLTDAENAFENANGIKTLYRKGGYVFHAQDVDESFGMPSTGQAQEAAGAPAPFRHIRDYQTYAEAIANGVSPVSLNAIDLLQKRLELGQRLIRYGDWADEFQKLTDPHTQLPIARPPEVRTRADGTEDMTAPAGYQLVHFAGKDFALHNGYAGLFGDLTKPSWMQGTEFRQNVMKTFSGMKHATLLLDTYHMARLAFWNSMTRLGLPTYARGVTLLDNTTPELQKMIANGEIPREWGENLVERKQVLERMVRQGLNVGSVGDNLYTDFLRNIPGIGSFNKWLFGKYQRGAMAEVALIEHDRQKQMFPNLDDNQLAARVAKDVNTRFGNLQSQSWIKSRTGQDLARIIFLAPQWNESLIRAELGAMRQLAAAPGQSFRAGRPAMGALARSVGTAMLGIFVGNQLINMATRGHPTWENPEEEAGSKISAYIPDLLGGPGFFLNPMSVPMEITNLLWRASERHGGDLTLALRDFAAGRFSGLAKGVWTAMTGYTPMGQPVKGGWSRVGESIAQAAPLPISGGPVVRGIAQAVTGENREKYPGEIQKQAMQSFGVKTEPVPDAQRRMYDLAAKFKQSKGIVEPPTREMSFYGDLTSAVKTGNMKSAGEALDKILTLAKGSGEPHTLDDVDKYYRQYPQRTFTNNKSMEGAFKRTLNPEQQRVYNQAVKDRQNIAATVQRLIAQRRR